MDDDQTDGAAAAREAAGQKRGAKKRSNIIFGLAEKNEGNKVRQSDNYI